MKAQAIKSIWSNSSRPPRFVTTVLVAGTTALRDRFGPDVKMYFANTFSITVVGTVMFDLLITTDGIELTPAELVEHIETVVMEDLKLQSANPPILLSTAPMPDILYELHKAMREQIWPSMANNPIRRTTAKLQRINYEVMEINFARVETHDGS